MYLSPTPYIPTIITTTYRKVYKEKGGGEGEIITVEERTNKDVGG